MLGHYMPAAMMGGRDPQMQQNPMHQQQQQQHLLSQQQHLQQQHHNPQQQQPQQQHHGIQQQHQGQGQQGQFGPQSGGVGPPPNGQDMSLASVLHYLQTEWRRYERERNEWEIERAEMRVSALFVFRRVFR